MKVFTTLCVLIGLAILSCQAEDKLTPKILCSLVKEGEYVKDVDSCNVYYKCVKGKPERKQCPRGTVFDKEKVVCIESTHCDPIAERDCKNKVKGFVPDSSSCIGFYYCENGKVIGGRNCPDDMIFDPKLAGGSCVYENIDKKCSRDSSICSYVRSGAFFGSADSCSEWRQCSADGSLSKGECRDEQGLLKLDLTDGTCTYESDCRQITGGDPQKPVRRPPPPATITCEPNSPRFISDKATCGGYYYCEAGKTVGKWGQCNNNKFFDAAKSDCVSRTDVVCEYDRCHGIGPGVRWVGITGDGCRGFNYCKDGEQMVGEKSQLCGRNLYFNEIQQRCIPTEVKHASCAVPPPPPNRPEPPAPNQPANPEVNGE